MDALVDLTGGLAERYELKGADPNMYRHLRRAHKSGAFIACSRKVGTDGCKKGVRVRVRETGTEGRKEGDGPGGGHLPNFCMRVCQHSFQFFGEKYAVFLANFAEMYPFMNKIAKKWCVAPNILRIAVE